MDAMPRPHVASSPRPPLLSPLLTSVTAVRDPAHKKTDLEKSGYRDIYIACPVRGALCALHAGLSVRWASLAASNRLHA